MLAQLRQTPSPGEVAYRKWQTGPHAQNFLRLPDGTARAFQYFPSTSDTTMLLLRATQETIVDNDKARDLHAFARYAGADGLTRVILPEPLPHTRQDSRAWVRAVGTALPDEPVIVGTVDATNTLQIEVAGNYYGKDCTPPEMQSWQARDGSALACRYFAADTQTVVILMHGGGSHAVPYTPLAQFICGRGLAQVYAPNLRGHFLSGQTRGDVEYIGQMEDDLADLLQHIRAQTPNAHIVLAGHSWGGGLVIRFAGGKYASQIDGCILLAPYPGPALSIFRRTADAGWAKCFKLRVALLALLNVVQLRAFNRARVVHIDIPPAVQDAMSTTDYSYRAFVSFSPHWMYWQNLQRIRQPLLALLGEDDGIFDAKRLRALLARHTRAQIHIVPNASHMGIAFSKQTHALLRDWLGTLNQSH